MTDEPSETRQNRVAWKARAETAERRLSWAREASINPDGPFRFDLREWDYMVGMNQVLLVQFKVKPPEPDVKP